MKEQRYLLKNYLSGNRAFVMRYLTLWEESWRQCPAFLTSEEFENFYNANKKNAKEICRKILWVMYVREDMNPGSMQIWNKHHIWEL